MSFTKNKLLILFFSFAIHSTPVYANVTLQTEQSLYLGETKTLSFEIPSELSQNLAWNIDNTKLKQLDAADLVIIGPSLNAQTKKFELKLTAAYISSSFDAVPIIITGTDKSTERKVVDVTLVLSVRAELVIRFRPRTEKLFMKNLSEQSDSVFEWDLPLNAKTGEYTPITVNNHRRGLWVRFRYDGPPSQKLLRDGGNIIHIYAGEGEYIVHQPFDNETHLWRSDCPIEPIKNEEWKNPELGLTAKGTSWANCEFRGYVPNGTAYGFGFREHYLEGEIHEKRVEIKNTGELNKNLIAYYKFLEDNGLGLSALCTAW